jgi:pimeloyl-ACP methyl ester carboxylesterase
MPEISTVVTSRLSYRKMGSGPVVFLLHGFPESSPLWRNIWDELSRSFTLFMPDFPGSGNSVLEKDTGIGDMADCVKSIMDTEGISKAVVAGHSMGGYVAFAFAAKYLERVQGLSLIHSIPLPDDEEKKKNRLKSIDLVQKGAKKAFVSQMIPNLFSESFKHSNPAVVEEQVQQALEISEEGLINFFRAMIARSDQTNVLDKAVFPVQWIIGKEDNIISHKKILEFCFRSGINFVSFYNSCGHMSMFEAPGQLTKDLVAFINYSYAKV